jgi:hypothetical protein
MNEGRKEGTLANNWLRLSSNKTTHTISFYSNNLNIFNQKKKENAKVFNTVLLFGGRVGFPVYFFRFWKRLEISTKMLYFRKTTDKLEQDVDDALFIIWYAIDYNIRTKVHQNNILEGWFSSVPSIVSTVQMKYGRFFLRNKLTHQSLQPVITDALAMAMHNKRAKEAILISLCVASSAHLIN